MLSHMLRAEDFTGVALDRRYDPILDIATDEGFKVFRSCTAPTYASLFGMVWDRMQDMGVDVQSNLWKNKRCSTWQPGLGAGVGS